MNDYDRGALDMLEKVSQWLYDNLEDYDKFEDRYLFIDGTEDEDWIVVVTQNIIDDLYDKLEPQQSSEK